MTEKTRSFLAAFFALSTTLFTMTADAADVADWLDLTNNETDFDFTLQNNLTLSVSAPAFIMRGDDVSFNFNSYGITFSSFSGTPLRYAVDTTDFGLLSFSGAGLETTSPTAFNILATSNVSFVADMLFSDFNTNATILNNAGKLSVEKTISFSGNKTQNGVINNSGEMLLLGGGSFTGNTSGSSAAIVNTGTLTITGTHTFANNTNTKNSVSSGGGGIFNNGGTLKISAFGDEKILFKNNTAAFGSGIYNYGNNVGGGHVATLYLTGVRPNNSYVADYGGASTIIFDGNIATNQGASLNNYGESTSAMAIAHIDTVDIINHVETGKQRGAFRGDQNSLSNFRNVLFKDNVSLSYGGGISSSNTGIVILNLQAVLFEGNRAGYSGGGITNGGTLTIVNSSFINNRTAVVDQTTGLVKSDALILGGGGASFNGTTLYLIADKNFDTIFSGNTVTGKLLKDDRTVTNLSEGLYLYKDSGTPKTNSSAATENEKRIQTIYFNAGNGGSIIFDDTLRGFNHLEIRELIPVNLNKSDVTYTSFNDLLTYSVASHTTQTRSDAPTDGKIFFNNNIRNIEFTQYAGSVYLANTYDAAANGIDNTARTYLENVAYHLNGGLLSLENGGLEKHPFKEFTVDGDAFLALDLDLSKAIFTAGGSAPSIGAGAIDYIDADITGTGTITLESIGVMNDFTYETGTAPTLGDTAYFKFAKTNIVPTSIVKKKVVIVTGQNGYYLKINTTDKSLLEITRIMSDGGLPTALAAGKHFDITAQMGGDGDEVISQWATETDVLFPVNPDDLDGEWDVGSLIGTNVQAGSLFALNGNNKGLTCTGDACKKGIVVGSAGADQTFEVLNISGWKGFNGESDTAALTAMNNATLRLENIMFENNSIDVKNNGKMTLVENFVSLSEGGIDGSGQTNVETGALVSVYRKIKQALVKVAENSRVYLAADAIDSEIQNEGALAIWGAEGTALVNPSVHSVTGTGTTTFVNAPQSYSLAAYQENSRANGAQTNLNSITQKNITINSNVILTNEGVLTATGADNSNIQILNGAKVTSGASNLVAQYISNIGILNLTDGTLSTKLQDASQYATLGTLNIQGNVVNNTDIIQSKISVLSDAALTSDSQKITIGQGGFSVAEGGTLNLTGTANKNIITINGVLNLLNATATPETWTNSAELAGSGTVNVQKTVVGTENFSVAALNIFTGATYENNAVIKTTLNNTGNITSTGTLTLLGNSLNDTSGTITQANVVVNSGLFTNKGTVTADNVNVQTSGTLTNEGTLTADEITVQTSGTFANIGTLNADVLSLDTGAAVTTTSSFTAQVKNKGTISIGTSRGRALPPPVVAIGASENSGTISADLVVGNGTTVPVSVFTNTGTLSNVTVTENSKFISASTNVSSLTNNGTFEMTDATLNTTVAGTGTTTFTETNLTFGNQATIVGTADFSGKTVSLTENELATTNIGRIIGDFDLKFDANMATGASDILNITSGTPGNATLNIVSMNITQDGAASEITYMTADTGASLDGINIKLSGSSTGNLVTATDEYTYTFSQAADKGKLTVTSTFNTTPVTLQKFMEGSLTENADSYAISEDKTFSSSLGDEIGTTSNSQNDELTIYLNDGSSLIGDNTINGFVVDDGYALNLTAQTTASEMKNFGTALTVNENAEASLSNLTFSGNTTDIINNGTLSASTLSANNIENNGTLSLLGTSTLGTVSGDDGSLNISSGTTTVTTGDTVTQGNVNVTSSGTLDNNGTVTTTLNNAGIVSGTGDLILSGDSVNTGTIEQNSVTVKGTLVSSGSDITTGTNGITVENGASLTFASGTNNNAVENNGTLVFTSADSLLPTSSGAISGTGDLTFNDNTTNTATINQGTVTVAENKKVTSSGTIVADTINLQSGSEIENSSSITGNIQNNGTFSGTGAVTALGDSVNNGTISSPLSIDGNFVNNGVLGAQVTVSNTSSLTTGLTDQTDNIINNGTIYVSQNSVLNSAITGSGTTVFNAPTTVNSGSFSNTSNLVVNDFLDLGSNSVSVNNVEVNGTLGLNLDQWNGGSSYTGGNLAADAISFAPGSQLMLNIGRDFLNFGETTDELTILDSSSITGIDVMSLLATNNMYNYTRGSLPGTVIIERTQSLSDVMAPLSTINNLQAVNAWSEMSTPTGSVAEDVQNRLNSLAQYDAPALARAVNNLTPSDSQLRLMTAKETGSIIDNEVFSHMFNEPNDHGVWGSFIGRHSKQKTDSQNNGFSANSVAGIAGISGKLGPDTIIEAGLMHGKTNGSSNGLDTDITETVAFGHVKYQPSKWYFRSLLGLGVSDYSEKADVAGLSKTASYHGKTAYLRGAAGYEVTPSLSYEAGINAIRLALDGYEDSLGQKISKESINTSSADIKARYALKHKNNGKTYAAALTVGAQYDLTRDDMHFDVQAYDKSYKINSRPVDRFKGLGGVEASVSNGKWGVELEYSGDFNNNYQNHTGKLSFVWNFGENAADKKRPSNTRKARNIVAPEIASETTSTAASNPVKQDNKKTPAPKTVKTSNVAVKKEDAVDVKTDNQSPAIPSENALPVTQPEPETEPQTTTTQTKEVSAPTEATIAPTAPVLTEPTHEKVTVKASSEPAASETVKKEPAKSEKSKSTGNSAKYLLPLGALALLSALKLLKK